MLGDRKSKNRQVLFFQSGFRDLKNQDSVTPVKELCIGSKEFRWYLVHTIFKFTHTICTIYIHNETSIVPLTPYESRSSRIKEMKMLFK